MARFFLMLDGVRILTLDDLKAHFKPLDALDRFRSGALQRWLAEQHLEDLLAKVEAIDEPSDDATIRALGTVFGLANYAEESLGTLDEALCNAESDEEIKGIFEGPDGEHNLLRLEKLAMEGRVDAQRQLAYMYGEGLCVSKDDKKAFQLFLRAAETGDAVAQYDVGVMLKTGKGTEQDYEKAFEWFLKAATQGYVDAQIEVGLAYMHGLGTKENLHTAIIWFENAAVKNNPDAMFWMAKCYGKWGVHRKVAKHLRSAADLGHAEACDDLGLCYLNGIGGVEEDAETAVEWFRKAANRGYADGMFHLGKCYYSGNGVNTDAAEAFKWFQVASDNGAIEAKAWLGECYLFGIGIEEDVAMGVTLVGEAAVNGVAAAQARLGVCYYYGKGVEENLSLAIKWWEKAVEQGEVHAIGYLGAQLLDGNGIQKDQSRGFMMLKRAAEETGDNEFQRRVGRCYENGWGVAQSKSEAIKWYKIAADSGDAEAARRYRICSGKGGFFESFFYVR